MKTLEGKLKFDSIKKNQNGYLIVSAIIARSGILNYGTNRKEFVPEDELLKTDSLDTLVNLPVTQKHPKDGFKHTLLNPENTTKHQRGITLGQPKSTKFDGDPETYLEIDLMIQDKDTISAVENKQLTGCSLGYVSKDQETPGEHNGQKYDAIQTNRIYNHLALVETPRAGDKAKVKLDDGTIIHFDDIENDVNPQPLIINSQRKVKKMAKIKIDSHEFDVENDVAIAYENKIKSDEGTISDLKSQNERLKAEKDETKAKLDETTAKYDELKSRDHKEEALNSLKLQETAKKYLDDSFKFDGLSDTEIKKAVVEKARNIKLDGQSDDYIKARYDSFIEDQGNSVTQYQHTKAVLSGIPSDTKLDDATADLKASLQARNK